MSDQINEVELSNKGQKVQAATTVATTAVGGLLAAGVIGASVSNPILLGITVLSAFLPSLFKKKKPAPAMGLLGTMPADSVGGGGAAAAGAVILQLVSILTAIAGMLGQVHEWLPFIPASWQPWIVLSAAAIAGFVPGLQKLGELLKGGGAS